MVFQGGDTAQSATLAPDPFVYDDDDIRADSAHQTTHSASLVKQASSTFSNPIRSPPVSSDHTAPHGLTHIRVPTSPDWRTDITWMQMRPQAH